MRKKVWKPKDPVLILRTCDKDMKSHGGFQWPDSGYVECPDFTPTKVCGNGFHGLLWGEGNWSLLNWDPQARWMICQAEKSELIDLDRKVKFPRCNVIGVGNMALMCELFMQAPWWPEAVKAGAASSGNSSKAASSGYGSTAASSGNSSTAASSGNSSTAASSGKYSTAASSGDSSTAASSGKYSTAASSGYGSKAASSGDSSTASAEGENTIACVAGLSGTASAGPNGCFTLHWHDGSRARAVTCYVGENGIEPNTLYRLDDSGKAVKA